MTVVLLVPLFSFINIIQAHQERWQPFSPPSRTTTTPFTDCRGGGGDPMGDTDPISGIVKADEVVQCNSPGSQQLIWVRCHHRFRICFFPKGNSNGRLMDPACVMGVASWEGCITLSTTPPPTPAARHKHAEARRSGEKLPRVSRSFQTLMVYCIFLIQLISH